MPTRLRRWLVPVLAAAVFAPALATLWVEVHVARHHEGGEHHHGAGHQKDAGHHHGAGHPHGAGPHEAAVHHDPGQRPGAGHLHDQHRYDGTPQHSHVTPDPRHEPAARRGLVTAAVGLAGSALPAVVAPSPPLTPRSPSLLRPHRGPPPPLFASHCALLL